MGLYVQEFENQLSDYLCSGVACVSSGTAALQLALESLDIESGSGVLVPSITYVATYQAITAAGYKPIPVDIDKKTCNINLESISKVPTSSYEVIVPVLYSGDTAHYMDILDYAKNHSKRVICDAAHAFGSSINSIPIGCFGDITCFSFDGIKTITSGEGGAVVTKDERVLSKVKDKRLLGVHNDTDKRYASLRSWDFDVTEQGWRYHMSNVHAAIGLAQFKRKDLFFSKRKKLAINYDRLVFNVKGVSIFSRDYSNVVPHIYPVVLDIGIDRSQVIAKLASHGIQSGIHYKPNHTLTLFSNLFDSTPFLPNTEAISDRLLSLPLHTKLTKSKQSRIVKTLALILDELYGCH